MSLQVEPSHTSESIEDPMKLIKERIISTLPKTRLLQLLNSNQNQYFAQQLTVPAATRKTSTTSTTTTTSTPKSNQSKSDLNKEEMNRINIKKILDNDANSRLKCFNRDVITGNIVQGGNAVCQSPDSTLMLKVLVSICDEKIVYCRAAHCHNEESINFLKKSYPVLEQNVPITLVIYLSHFLLPTHYDPQRLENNLCNSPIIDPILC
ncbi:hypothetical protein PPL_07331 [Heterostelium album PN500]|uniref:Uncharacterized protein n=1 Tax=Heterostelium pallidum (strain ATCC 26659 / Pp 5 / PN500) TaxID=670386 RepID=D3BF14_HETP5|nr:hypothetical protein PPL_07331 [Heterostelium album PN500]EFA80495.1 hypothetical protein PPL_07331 [Heterostelium album PN500]|eukprot:XP_020432615.1 hypothetical protein PPL_07331 [Heterostelium album PN500]